MFGYNMPMSEASTIRVCFISKESLLKMGSYYIFKGYLCLNNTDDDVRL
jgi:hypothetical protein